MSKKAKQVRKEKREKINDEFHQRVLNGNEEVEEIKISEPTTFEEDLKEIQEFEEKKIIKTCETKGCRNEAMKTTPICLECYKRISSEMAKGIKKGDDAPMKIM